jgi:nitroreductase
MPKRRSAFHESAGKGWKKFFCGYTAYMHTLEAIHTRRAVRKWSDTEVADDLVLQVLDAGHMSPSPLNSQPWHFTVVRNKETIAKLMEQAHHGSFLSLANVVIVVSVTQQAKVDEWLAEHEQHIFAGACAMQNMWLAAWDMGLGACWVTLNDKTTRALLDIPPEQKLLGSIALGYADGQVKPHGPDDRRALESMVSYEKFGKKN